LLNEGESKIRRSIARFFVNRQRDDLLLLYFSGHGVRNDQGQLFLAANDTEISILDATGIPADFVTHAMNNSRSQRQLLVLDCCNSGAFAHGSKSASAIGKSMGIATAFEGSGFGRVVLTATDSTQYAWEGDKVIGNTQKSVFTHFLIEGLKGNADRDGDGRIHVDELYDYAYEQVVRRTPKQTPGKWSYKQQGDLILRDNLKPRDVKPVPLPSDLLYYLDHPSSGVRSTGVEELIRLLDGKHLGLARAAQEKLREIAENDDSLSLRKIASETFIAHGFEPKRPEAVGSLSETLREEKPVLSNAEGNIENLAIVPPRRLPEKKEIVPDLNLRLVGGIAGGLLIITLLIWGGSKLLQNLPAVNPEPTRTFPANMTFTSRPSTTDTSQPSKTDTPSPTQTSVPQTQSNIPTTSNLGIGSTMTSEKDDMTLLYVPAGEFMMGSDNGALNQYPAHVVNLDAFWIDETEVTNAMYNKCVKDGDCNLPHSNESRSRDQYYGNSEFDLYPVIQVSWEDAETYCTWAKRRLPTEAEWEKSARGENGRTYPWGNARPNDNLLNYLWEQGADTTAVGNYPDGASPYGALDMAGNVWEWVSDFYSNNYYRSSPTSNPLGPDTGDYYNSRVIRGGSWDSENANSSYRGAKGQKSSEYNIGFRCAMSAAP